MAWRVTPACAARSTAEMARALRRAESRLIIGQVENIAWPAMVFPGALRCSRSSMCGDFRLDSSGCSFPGFGWSKPGHRDFAFVAGSPENECVVVRAEELVRRWGWQGAPFTGDRVQQDQCLLRWNAGSAPAVNSAVRGDSESVGLELGRVNPHTAHHVAVSVKTDQFAHTTVHSGNGDDCDSIPRGHYAGGDSPGTRLKPCGEARSRQPCAQLLSAAGVFAQDHVILPGSRCVLFTENPDG